MELKINSIDGISNLSFAFYRAAYFLTLNKRLPWSKVANGELVAKVTNEFNVYLRYYDNKKTLM